MPRTQLAIFAAVILAAAGLAFLASRSLESQRILLEQAAAETERRSALAAAEAWERKLDEVAAPFLAPIPDAPGVAGVTAALVALEGNPAVAAAFAFDRSGRLAWPPAGMTGPVFVEAPPADAEGRGRLRAAYRQEFVGKDPGGALAVYAAVGDGAYGRTLRVEAKMQEAALAAKGLDRPRAIAAYAAVLDMWRFAEPETRIVAWAERARLLRESGWPEAEDALLRFAETAWGGDPSFFGDAAGAARERALAGLAGVARPEAGTRRREAELGRAKRIRGQDAAREMAAGVVPALAHGPEPPRFAALGGGLLAAWRTGRNGLTFGAVLRVPALALAGPGALVAGRDTWAGALSPGGASAALRGASGLAAALPPTGEAAAGIRRQRLLYLAGLLVLLAALASGLFLSFRAVRREGELAKLKSDFVANVSHELKTPLALVRMYAETLALGRVTEEGQKKEYTEVILRESERLSAMIERILDFARIEKGERAYDRRPGDLAAAARSAAEAFAKQSGVPVAIDAPRPVLTAFDADGVALAVRNLLENAAKYSNGTPGIELAARIAGGHAVLAVADRGIGIRPDERARIFERFYRSADSRARKVKGTGLGLALVAHVMEGHGGRARCEARDGGGTVFVLEFPVTRGRGDRRLETGDRSQG
ncbi:MAG: HAMP domain-containing histidine kinase [Planctomycetes bacterium]|nr:HAMP domain-containing histidine kinase [Planctomycetota bacterium]